MKIKVLWSGITGNTANEVKKVIANNSNYEITVGLSRNNENYYNYNELEQIKEDYDIIIDFSHKDNFKKILNLALTKNKPLIIGTSGLSEEEEQELAFYSKVIPIFRGGNFRIGVKEFIDQVTKYAKSHDEIKLIETHYTSMHLPSETAKVIKRRVKETTGKELIISSSYQNLESTNDWQVGNLRYHCGIYDEALAQDILTIASIMVNKRPGILYDLDNIYPDIELKRGIK